MQLSRQEVKTKVCPIKGHAEVNYHKKKTADSSDWDAVMWRRKQNILCDCESLSNI